MTYSINLANLRSEFGDEGRIVGFGGTYFTLWTYKITEDQDSHRLIFDAFFNKNIGKENPYTSILPYDENLKGKILHIEQGNKAVAMDLQKQFFHCDKFTMNPLRGMLIEDCEDTGLLCWKYENNSVDHRYQDPDKAELELTNIKNRAIELGCVCINNKLYSPKVQSLDWFKTEMTTRQTVETGAPIEKTMKFNIHIDGSITIGFYEFRFPNIKVVPATYYGPEYAMPIDKKGKAKRIKGKTLIINSYEHIVIPAHEEKFINSYGDTSTYTAPEEDYYNILDWELAK